MKTYLFRLAGLIAVLGFLSACSASRIYHENLMAGQVVRAEDNQVVLCIGNEGGAEEGMTFNAYRVTYEGAITEDTDEYDRTEDRESAHFTAGDEFKEADMEQHPVLLSERPLFADNPQWDMYTCNGERIDKSA